MKTFMKLLLVGVLGSGCIIVPRHHHRGFHPGVVVRNDCPPGHHWDGNVCRHNGHGRGHGNRR